MSAGTWLDSTQLADPSYEHDGYVLAAEDIGALHSVADGDVVYDTVGTRYRFALKWQAITYAQKNTIRTCYLDKTTQTFHPPDEDVTTYTVLVVPNSWRETYIEDGDGTKRYQCEMELVETAV